MKAISLFTKEDVKNIKCIDNREQVTDVVIYFSTVSISGEAKTCRIIRERTDANAKGKNIAFTHVDMKTGKTLECKEEQATIANENRYRVTSCNTGPTMQAQQLLEMSSRRYNGLIRMPAADWDKIPTAPEPTIAELQANPSSFNEVTAHPGCASYEIQDQGSCGSCWAFAAARVYGDRLCRANKARWNAAMSEQDIVSCYTSGGFYMNGATQVDGPAGTWQARDGCNGGNHLTQWIAQAEPGGGRVARWADPYTGKGKDVDACGTVDSKAIRFSVTKGSIYKIPVGAVNTMKTQIYAGGSIGAGVDIYTDFSSYSGGVYIKSSNDYAGAHAVALVGWGSDGGVDYWVLANSWGKGWGESGYGRIRRGTNEAKIENECSYMAPSVPTKCSSSTACANGEFDSDCSCRCRGAWTGSTCSSCSISCQNGGSLISGSCSCSCPSGYSGNTCQDYILARWKSKNGDHATIEFKWKLSAYNDGSYFTRFANPPNVAGSPQIGGTRVNIDQAEGSVTANVGWYMMVPNFPEAFFYAFVQNLGTNEFGASRGTKTIALPALYFDKNTKCLSGGHKPVAADVQNDLCSGASWTPSPVHEPSPVSAPSPSASSSSATAAPKHSHNPHSHNPHRHTPHSHTPHRHNPHSHSPAPASGTWQQFNNYCVAADGRDQPEKAFPEGNASRGACQELCKARANCSAFEWYAGGWGGSNCKLMLGGAPSAKGQSGSRWQDAECHVKPTR